MLTIEEFETLKNEARYTEFVNGMERLLKMKIVDDLTESGIFTDDELSSGNPLQEPTISNTIKLTDWQLEVTGDDVPNGSYVSSGDALGDWSKNENLKYVASVGTYTATLTINEVLPNKRYILDLGWLIGIADVSINGKTVGHTIFSPYQVDITKHLINGRNVIVIEMTPALRNSL